MVDQLFGDIGLIAAWVLALLIAVPLHEAAHGFVAWWLGDDTAYKQGRVSANPLRHIDPFGTIILPIMLLLATNMRFTFGFAKPVPVNFRQLNNPRRDMVLVAAAGPGINLLIGLAAAIGLRIVSMIPGGAESWTQQFLEILLVLNVFLAVFNMLPIPPLDGGRVAVGLLPRALAYPLARLERMGIFIVIGVLFLLPMLLEELGIGFNPAEWLVHRPAIAVAEFLVRIVGLR
jgi:Zn-dependent protease